MRYNFDCLVYTGNAGSDCAKKNLRTFRKTKKIKNLFIKVEKDRSWLPTNILESQSKLNYS